MEDLNATDDVIINNDSTGDVITEGQPNGSDPSQGSQTNGVNDEIGPDGVSYKNRFLELERKYQNLNKSIPQMIQEAAQQTAQKVHETAPKQAEYSLNDYLQAKLRDPGNAAYYESKILELQKREISETVRNEIAQSTRKQQEDAQRQQAETWAVTNFPQLRDNNNAFTQQVWATFNSRPADKREPYDFALAAEIVAARMGVKSVATVNPQQDKLIQKEREVKKLIKERAIEGDGRGRSVAPLSTQKQADLKSALEGGNTRDYIQKYWLKPKEAEE